MASIPTATLHDPARHFESDVLRGVVAVERARRFREAAVARETGFRPAEDLFDEHGEILAVTDAQSGDIVGSCRVLAPMDARRAGGNDIDRRFDTALLIVLRDRMVEVDTPYVHPLYRFESVITHLWSALARYLIANRHDYVIGTARVGMLDGGHIAASTHRLACAKFLSPDDYRVHPRHGIGLERLSDTRSVALSPLFKSWMEAGAWVCGEPAHRPQIAAAEFPMLMPLARMQGREARQFLARAA
jgi:putative hemolysin